MHRIFNRTEDFIEYFKKSDLKDLPIVATSGGFDPLHVGHLRCIEETHNIAADIGGVSVIIVNGDGFLERKKGKPFMKHEERMEIICGLYGSEFIVGWDDGSQTVTECLRILKPKIFAKGGDRSERSKIPEADVCDEIGCEIRFGVGGTDKVQSSSALIAGSASEVNKINPDAARTIKPWGYEDLIHVGRYAAKIISINDGKRLSRQYHQRKDETICVLDGTLQLEIGNLPNIEKIIMKKGECRRIKPLTIHRFCALNGNIILFEASTPELDDVIRVEDDYGRDK